MSWAVIWVIGLVLSRFGDGMREPVTVDFLTSIRGGVGRLRKGHRRGDTDNGPGAQRLQHGKRQFFPVHLDFMVDSPGRKMNQQRQKCGRVSLQVNAH